METVKHWLSKSWVFVLLGGILAILVFPYAASAYHLEAGGRALDQIGESANPHLQSAIRHLQSAIRWDAENAQAYRLLGRAYLAQGNPVAAAEALTRFTELRPDNPLGHIELAGVYEAMAAELEAHTRYDFLAHLPEAKVETAGFWVDTLFCEEGDPPEKCYVAETTFHMPDDATPRPTLFMHAPSRASYTVTLPDGPVAFSFGMGLHPLTWCWGGDGVTYEVFVDDGAGEQQVLAQRLDVSTAMEGWHEEQVDLGSYAGRTVTLTLSVIPGPEWEMTGDWAGWGEPRIVDAEALTLVTLRPAEQMVREWRAAGLTAQDFIARGEEERKAKRYREALEWYERAAWVEPGMGDVWYYIGLAYEGMERWEEALEAHERAAELNPELARAYIAQATVLAFGYGNYEQARAKAEEGIQLGSQDAGTLLEGGRFFLDIGDNERAEQVLRTAAELNPGNLYITLDLGRSLFAQERFTEALATFKQASLIRTGDWQEAIAHVWLGRTYVALDRLQDALSEFELAAKLHPADSDNFVRLGDVYRSLGDQSKAIEAYQQALSVDPTNELAQERIGDLRR